MHSDDDTDDAPDDRELPDESDMDSFDEPGLDACPHCRKLIVEDIEQCPHCGQYISAEDAPGHPPVWIVATVILLGLSFLFWIIFGR